MILYTLAAAFLTGLIRGRVWTVPLLVVAAVMFSLGMGSDWNFDSYKPYNNPIFINLVLQLGLVNIIASVVGYSVGRLVAWGWWRVTRGD